MTVTVNILAFFIVVASSQISPHFPFRTAKIVKISDIQMDRMYFIFFESTSFSGRAGIETKVMSIITEMAIKVPSKFHIIIKMSYLRGIKTLLFISKAL